MRPSAGTPGMPSDANHRFSGPPKLVVHEIEACVIHCAPKIARHRGGVHICSSFGMVIMTLQDHARGARGVARPTSGQNDNTIATNPMRDAEAAGHVPWHSAYRRAALVTDAIVLVIAVLLAEFIRFGLDVATTPGSSLTYTLLGIGIASLWWIALQLDGAADVRILGHGPSEYRRVLHASVMAFGLLAIATLLFKQDLSRGYLAIAFPVGLVGLLVSRKMLRIWLVRLRRRGGMMTNILVVGGARSAESIDTYFARHPEAGFRVTGVWVPDQADLKQRWLQSPDRFVPVLGSSRRLDDALRIADAGGVIVTDSEHLGHTGLKELTWELQAHRVELMVSPNVIDVATPRVTLRNVGSMPFLHLEKPQYEGATRWGKVLFDKAFAAAALVALSPLFVVAYIAIRCTSHGPVLYRSERIGVGGMPFEMLKFRSMVTDADLIKTKLQSDDSSVLFKIRDDPRVTQVGRVLRRYSIDELPQLLNVLRGEMSIVGPRPPLRSEVEQYDEGVGRRLLVKQGITGLWQVSGRSDLTWDDTVRLDLDYVENWSLLRDMRIIWMTVRAVLGSKGAY